MSRNDTYLSLCLEQASLSPLHYRHGAIIVRGGKVIGQGYNDYRSGYNGGAESSGQMSSALYSKAVITNDSKPKNLKNPHLSASSGHKDSSKNKSLKNYVAFDSQNHALGTGGGSLANTPLSMHSEMMAINSALSLSSAIACQGTARSTHTSKRTLMPSAQTRRSGRRPRSAVASLTFNSLVLKLPQSRPLQHHPEDYYGVEKEEEENHVSKRQNKGYNGVHHHPQINYLNFQNAKSEIERQLTKDNKEKHRNQDLYGIHNSSQDHQHSGHIAADPQEHHRSSALVVPENRILSKSYRNAERIKDSRLNGADLYVARLGRVRKFNDDECSCQPDKADDVNGTTTAGESREQLTAESSSTTRTQPMTGSLHDELRFPTPRKPSRAAPKAESLVQQATATYSRPCYRCISYMHSAGVKRVFWTNAEGEWEGGKVRELADALEQPTSAGCSGSTSSFGGGSVYMTKSEVLIMKRLR
ncbi:MAG: hypothetical protein Q9195_005621 [Heterodermia aff. obscurata]